jgi:hypothetical protein
MSQVLHGTSAESQFDQLSLWDLQSLSSTWLKWIGDIPPSGRYPHQNGSRYSGSDAAKIGTVLLVLDICSLSAAVHVSKTVLWFRNGEPSRPCRDENFRLVTFVFSNLPLLESSENASQNFPICDKPYDQNALKKDAIEFSDFRSISLWKDDHSGVSLDIGTF